MRKLLFFGAKNFTNMFYEKNTKLQSHQKFL